MTRDQQISTLSYSVRGRVLAKYLGQLGLVTSALTIVPFVVSLLYGEFNISVRYLAVIAVLAVTCYQLSRVSAPEGIQMNEALAITALAFTITPLLMSFPLTASLSFGDALFEAISGISTTGLSVAGSLTDKPHAFLFGRAWLQWVGGLGIVVLSVALVIGPGSTARRLAFPEMNAEDLAGGSRAHARRMIAVYSVLTLAGFLILWAMGVKPFIAMSHVLAAVSTGGFSTVNGTLGGVGSWYVQAALIGISFMGAISLSIYYFSIQKGLGGFLKSPEPLALLMLAIMFSGILAAGLSLFDGYGLMDAMREAPLMAISAQSTAGFANIDISGLSPVSKLLLLFPMLIGGNIGSTAGGIKTFRLLVIMRLAYLSLQRTQLSSRAFVKPFMRDETLESEEVERIMLVVFLFLGVIVLSWIPFVAYGYDALDSLFEVVSATCTVGLSTGITGSEMPGILKGVLCMDMLMGRVEIVAMLILVYPGTWFGRRV